MEKEEQPIQPESDDTFDYFINRGNKIRDFWSGIFIGFSYVVLSLILTLSLDMITTWWFYILLFMIYIAGTLYFFIIKRKFGHFSSLAKIY